MAAFSFLFVFYTILPHFFFRGQEIISSADDDALAAGVGRDVLFLVGGAAAGLIVITASGSTTVKLDAITRAGDTVAFTSAAQR